MEFHNQFLGSLNLDKNKTGFFINLNLPLVLLQRLPIIYKLKFFFLRNMRTVECGKEREGGELMLGSAFLCIII